MPVGETRESVAARLERLTESATIGPADLLGGTDRGFETIANMAK